MAFSKLDHHFLVSIVLGSARWSIEVIDWTLWTQFQQKHGKQTQKKSSETELWRHWEVDPLATVTLELPGFSINLRLRIKSLRQQHPFIFLLLQTHLQVQAFSFCLKLLQRTCCFLCPKRHNLLPHLPQITSLAFQVLACKHVETRPPNKSTRLGQKQTAPKHPPWNNKGL